MSTSEARLAEDRAAARSFRKASLIRRILLAGGLALLGLLAIYFGPRGLVDMAARIGPRLIVVLVFPMVLVQLCFFAGWQLCFPRQERRPETRQLLVAHVAGEAFNTVTLLANLGGEPVKARLLRPRLAMRESLASVLVARTLRTGAQVIFLFGGMVLALVRLPMGQELRLALVVATLLLAMGILIFSRLQRRHLFSRALAVLQRLGLQTTVRQDEAVRDLDRHLRDHYAGRPGRLGASLAVQLLAFGLGAVEVAIACHLLGRPVTGEQAFLAEALGLGISTVFFVVPGGLGVSEGGRAAVFALLGLDPALGFAVGLVRRLRDLVWAGLGLAVYGAAGADR